MASIYDQSLMNAADVNRINALGDAWRNSTDREERRRLHDSAEQIRKSYGYSGGESGGDYIPVDSGVAAVSSAAKAYENALRETAESNQNNYLQQQAEADEQLSKRLREAYIGKLQSTLGLDQQLKAAGVSGGLSESTKAAYDNAYRKQRDNAYSDTRNAKTELAKLAAQSALESGEKIASHDYASALERVDRLTAAEKEAAERDLQERQFSYQQEKDAKDLAYRTSKDTADRELKLQQFAYEQEKDRLDREYQQKQDELELKYKQQALKAKSSGTSKSSSSTAAAKTDSTKVSNAWKLLNKGIYDDSFPEILGYSAEILKEYADNVLSGY